MSESSVTVITGVIVEGDSHITMAELCRACAISAEQLLELVEQGVVEPEGTTGFQTGAERWRFSALSISRVHSARRLQRDLGVNVAGAALALELIDEIEQLRRQLRQQGVLR